MFIHSGIRGKTHLSSGFSAGFIGGHQGIPRDSCQVPRGWASLRITLSFRHEGLCRKADWEPRSAQPTDSLQGLQGPQYRGKAHRGPTFSTSMMSSLAKSSKGGRQSEHLGVQYGSTTPIVVLLGCWGLLSGWIAGCCRDVQAGKGTQRKPQAIILHVAGHLLHNTV